MKRRFLLPGEMAATRDEMLLETLLGSCVAVCLENTSSSLAAMNHVLLPSGSGDVGKYADSATEYILAKLFALDRDSGHYRAHIVGGAELVAGSTLNIGDRNIEVVRSVLTRHDIAVIGEDVGGTHGRRLVFNTATGDVDIKVMASSTSTKMPEVTVLIVDGSEQSRSSMVKGLSGAPGVVVVGEAADPFEAREKIISVNPDVMTLGVEMKKMDGLRFLEALMRNYPLPVVVISWITRPGSSAARAALAKGAAEVVYKEDLRLYDGGETVRETLPPILTAASATQTERVRLV